MGLATPVMLLALGALAFFLEAFVPSSGAITLVALGCVVAAIAVAFNISAATGVVFLGIAIILVPACLIAMFKVLPKTPIGRRLTLKKTQAVDAGYVAQDAREEQLLGQTGVAISTLRPSGEAKINDRRYDVMTEGEMIEKGAALEVRRVEGNRIVVRRLRPGPTET